MNRYLSSLSHLSFSSFPSLRKSVLRRINHLSISPVTRRTGRTDRTGRTKRTGNQKSPWRLLCPTSLPVPVVTVVVLNVVYVMASVNNIASNATTTTTATDVHDPTARMRSTALHGGDNFEQRSSQRTRSAKRAQRKAASSPPTRSITRHRYEWVEIRGLGTIFKASAVHVIRVNQSRKDRDGSACRSTGGGPRKHSSFATEGGALAMHALPRIGGPGGLAARGVTTTNDNAFNEGNN